MPRKAATPKKAVELDRSRMPIMLAVVLMLGIGLTMGAIVWGRSDDGQIDVSATIANSQYVSDNAADSNATPVGVSSQEYIDMPNGGLIAAGGSEPPPPEPPVEEINASSTATTTEDSVGPEATEENTETQPDPAIVPEEDVVVTE